MQSYTTLYSANFNLPSWHTYEYTFRPANLNQCYAVPDPETSNFKIDYNSIESLLGSSFKKPVKKPEAPRMPEPAELLEFLNGEA